MSLADDYTAYLSDQAAAVAAATAAEQAATASASAAQLVTTSAAQVAADLAAGPAYVGPDSSGNVTVLAAAPGQSPPFSATVVPPASSVASVGSGS